VIEIGADQLGELAVQYGQRVVLAVLVYIIGRFVVAGVMRLVRRSFDLRKDLDPTVRSFLDSVIRSVLMIMVVLTVFQTLGIALTSFIAVLGAAALAVGLAFQGSLANFAGGVLILLFRPFNVGDFIDAGGTMGTVVEIRILYTLLNTFDNKRLVVPNGGLANTTVTNFSVNATRRIDLVYGVSYSADIDLVKQILSDTVAANDMVLSAPEPMIGVLEHGDSAIKFAVRVWVARENFFAATFALNESVKKAFDEAGVAIPFPQRDVHLYYHSSELPGGAL